MSESKAPQHQRRFLLLQHLLAESPVVRNALIITGTSGVLASPRSRPDRTSMAPLHAKPEGVKGKPIRGGCDGAVLTKTQPDGKEKDTASNIHSGMLGQRTLMPAACAAPDASCPGLAGASPRASLLRGPRSPGRGRAPARMGKVRTWALRANKGADGRTKRQGY